ncbi:beta-1,3-glucosyltransferase [Pseudanabaena sp. lw0831]|uniref:glycosyltransferase n=1 Tax=Pseudanabaena sp. lw0831 TaxID=1357935 RepID=UPI0019166B74|nr:glycosyltransferase [Pseudanabaena sp. lw0831]GBO54664.1 beta-1,3-glucosyltransferase [Pseudanabaena sp. lw0831]
MNELVSIIIPCYNAEKWIGECIDSALSQTYSPIEVIVIDDGSTDASLSIIEKYGNKIRWASYPNGGPSAARNRGFQISKGNYIQFIDADDYISPVKVKDQIEFLKVSGKDIVYGDWCYQYHNVDNTIQHSDYKTHQPDEDMVYYILSANKILHGSCLYRREVIEKILGFDESLRIAEDYDFLLRLAFSGAKFGYLEGCNYFYRIYSPITASHGQGIKHPNSVKFVLDKTSFYLAQKNFLTGKYRHLLACKYFLVAKSYLMIGSFKQSNTCYEISNNFSETLRFRSEGSSKFEKAYNLFGWKVTSLLMYALQFIPNRMNNLATKLKWFG